MEIKTNLLTKKTEPVFRQVPMGDIFCLKGSDELYVKAIAYGGARAVNIKSGEIVTFSMTEPVRIAKQLEVTF